MSGIEELYAKLQAFAYRIMVAVSIEAAGLLPRPYDTTLRKDEYGSVEIDPRSDGETET